MATVTVFGGAQPWHQHDEDDEQVSVVRGALRLELRDRPSIELREGESFVVPRGVEHRLVVDRGEVEARFTLGIVTPASHS